MQRLPRVAAPGIARFSDFAGLRQPQCHDEPAGGEAETTQIARICQMLQELRARLCRRRHG